MGVAKKQVAAVNAALDTQEAPHNRQVANDDDDDENGDSVTDDGLGPTHDNLTNAEFVREQLEASITNAQPTPAPQHTTRPSADAAKDLAAGPAKDAKEAARKLLSDFLIGRGSRVSFTSCSPSTGREDRAHSRLPPDRCRLLR